MDCAAWFGSSNGLFTMLGLIFVIGIAVGVAVGPYLPHRVKHFLGL